MTATAPGTGRPEADAGARLAPVALPPGEGLVADVFSAFAEEGREPVMLYRLLARSPRMLRGYSGLSRALRHESVLPRAVRELAILRMAQLAGSAYEWCHHREMAAAAGVTEVKVASLAVWRGSDEYSAGERAALGAVEQVHAAALGQAAFADLKRAWSDQGAVETVLLAAFYEMVARLIQGLGVEVEPDYARYLTDQGCP